MGVYTSTVILDADVAAAQSALENIESQLEKLESGTSNIELKVDAKGIDKTIGNVKKEINSLGQNTSLNKTFGDNVNLSILLDQLDKVKTELGDLKGTDITLGKDIDLSSLYLAVDNARRTISEMLSGAIFDTGGKQSDVLGQMSGQITIGEDAEEESERLSNAVSKINSLMKTYRAERTDVNLGAQVEKATNNYSDFDSERAQENLKNAQEAYEEYSEIYSKLQNLPTNENGNISLDTLMGNFSKEEILSLASAMQTLEQQTNNALSAVKTEAEAAGFETLDKNMDTLAKSITQVEDSLSNNKFSARSSDISKMLDGFSNVNTDKLDDVREQFTGLQSDLEDLNDCFDKESKTLDTDKLFNEKNWDAEKLEKFSASLDDVYKSAQYTTKELKNMGVDNNLMGKLSDGTYQKQIDNLKTSISNLGDSDAKGALNDTANSLQSTLDKMNGAASTGTAEGLAAASQYARELDSGLSAATSQMNELSASTSSTSSGMSTFMTGISSGMSTVMNYMSRFPMYMMVFRELKSLSKDLISTVTEIDTAMNQLQIVTGASGSEMTEFFESSIDMAKELGQSVTDVLDSVQVYSRLGYDLPDASELAKYTSILSNVAAVDVDEATTGLTSVIKGFDMEVSDAEHVSDVLIDIGQNYAVSASEILEAFQNSSAAFGATGTSFEEAAAIIAAGNAAVQNASLKTGLKVIEIYLERTPLIARTA